MHLKLVQQTHDDECIRIISSIILYTSTKYFYKFKYFLKHFKLIIRILTVLFLKKYLYFLKISNLFFKYKHILKKVYF